MRQLRDDTHLILDGEVRVYRRERSKRWQAAFGIEHRLLRQVLPLANNKPLCGLRCSVVSH